MEMFGFVKITEASITNIIWALGIYGLFLHYSIREALSFGVYQYFVMPLASFFDREPYVGLEVLKFKTAFHEIIFRLFKSETNFEFRK